MRNTTSITRMMVIMTSVVVVVVAVIISVSDAFSFLSSTSNCRAPTSSFSFGRTTTTTTTRTASFLTQRQQVHLTQCISSPTQLWMGVRGRGRPRGPLRTFVDKPPMNEEIDYDEIRVTMPGDGGRKDESLGVMSKAEALAKAQELGGLDLILINENGDPPVCKIMDYSKYRYEKEKAAKEKKKNSKSSELKEIKMSYKIDVHDYQVRRKSTEKFIKSGNRVKCSVVFRGREIQHDDLGRDLLEKLSSDLSDVLYMEGKPRKEGRSVTCIMSPKPDVLKKINEEKRRLEKAKKQSKQKQKESKGLVKKEEEVVSSADDDDEGDEASLMEGDDEEDDDDELDDDDDDDLDTLLDDASSSKSSSGGSDSNNSNTVYI